VPNDFRKANQAVNLGMPLIENHNNLLSDRYREIAGQIAGVGSPATVAKRSGFFTFSEKRVK
jgi:septum formation inhibitor-activating ATPase MinD